jgi:hypothetical protein
MASRRTGGDAEAWVKAYGEKLGAQLGLEIAASLKKTLEAKLDLSSLSKRKKGGAGGCSEAGCPNPVLAKGLCRSHYYKARYKSQKVTAKPSKRK